MLRPEGRRCTYARVGSTRPPLTSCHRFSPIARTRAAWCGASTVNRIPCSAMMSSVSTSTAVSASHMPSGRLPKRFTKSAMPQITCVRLSRVFASGGMMWL